MKLIGRFLSNCMSCLVRGLPAIPGVSRTVWKIGADLVSRRDFSNKLSMSFNIFVTLQLSNSNLIFLNLNWCFKVLFEIFGRTR